MHGRSPWRVCQWIVLGAIPVISDVRRQMDCKLNLAATFLMALVLCGCNRIASTPQPAPGGWTRSDVVNKNLVFNRKDGIDKSTYDPDGTVAVTILTDGQPPVAPLMYWTIDSDGFLLVSTDDDMMDAHRTRLVKREGSLLVVERNDGTAYNLTYDK
ncbi:hypothetical protein CA13_65600 [Planctomycetes bacterium CA13]|uniref:Uncharacterized protein n=1 Tax=Novipirellula herctigrandis TaxID=2527986 RepID=A0A5C5ZD42_9BACT|nr:hypothetical protein CA13_65600 [Planctomycetes bacterium CA13]